MKTATLDIIEALLYGDNTIDKKIIPELMESLNKIATIQPEPPFISRSDAAQLLSRSVKTIDCMARQGILKKVTLQGSKRSIGFLRSDVYELISKTNHQP